MASSPPGRHGARADAASRTAGAKPGPDPAPTHLYVLVHGFNSRAEHLQYMATEMQRRLGPRASVYLSSCNQARIPNFFLHPTHNGIDRGGERLALEIRDVVAKPEHRELEFISCLGNSMGGLFLRFAFGLLLDPATGVGHCHPPPPPRTRAARCLRHAASAPARPGVRRRLTALPLGPHPPCVVRLAGLIAGLKPVSFITTASPHLGIRGLVPKALEKTLRGGADGGRTAKQVVPPQWVCAASPRVRSRPPGRAHAMRRHPERLLEGHFPATPGASDSGAAPKMRETRCC